MPQPPLQRGPRGSCGPGPSHPHGVVKALTELGLPQFGLGTPRTVIAWVTILLSAAALPNLCSPLGPEAHPTPSRSAMTPSLPCSCRVKVGLGSLSLLRETVKQTLTPPDMGENLSTAPHISEGIWGANMFASLPPSLIYYCQSPLLHRGAFGLPPSRPPLTSISPAPDQRA